MTIGYVTVASRWSEPQKAWELGACRYDSGTHDAADDGGARRACSTRRVSVTRIPLRGRSGQEVWPCPDLPAKCVYELVTDHKEQLTNKVHRCGMHWHGIRIWIVAFGPEEVRQKLGDRQRCSDLLKLSNSIRQERNSVGSDSREENLTAMQKKRTKNPTSKNGISSHPTPPNTAKNPISMGSVTRKSVPITSLRLGFLPPSSHLLREVGTEGRGDMTE